MCLCLCTQDLCLAADLPAALVIGRAPLANMLDMPVATGADTLLVEPADADAG